MSTPDRHTPAAACEFGVFVLDPQGQVTSWSAGAVRLSGRQPEDMVGRHFSCLYEDVSGSAHDEILQKAVRDGSFEATVSLIHANGTSLTVRQTIEPLHDAGGAYTGFAVLARDVATHDRIAHDWNNVVQAIDSGIRALSLSIPPGSANPEILDILKRNVGVASNMMRQLLAYDSAQTQSTSATGPGVPLTGLRVLVVEDESLIALHAEELLTQLGCEVSATASTVAQALQSAQDAEMDFALLDINLRGERVYGVATALQARGIPFVFMSGDRTADAPWANHPTVHKPFQLEEMRREMERALHGA